MSHSETHSVPLVPLSRSAAKGLGTLISSIDEAEIRQRRWHPSGRRPVTSGGYGDTVEGPFDIYWQGEMMFSQNNAVGRADLLGWSVDPSEARDDREAPDRSRLLVDEVNYHDDGGQAFIAPSVPTVFLLAPPGDDVKPDDFVAFYSDGTYGMNMDPGVWHTAPLPLAERATYDNKQGSIHATVALWAREEWGLLLDVPLIPA
jgi:hypothetical protein